MPIDMGVRVRENEIGGMIMIVTAVAVIIGIVKVIDIESDLHVRVVVEVALLLDLVDIVLGGP
jgi:hypothetical protein